MDESEESMRISERDEAILWALARRVRLFSLQQIARHWWSSAKHPQVAARRRLRALEDEGWVVRVQPQARPLPLIEFPVTAWSPGRKAPDFAAVASRLRKRWTAQTRRVGAYVLGRTAERHLGVSHRGRLKYDFQATHDLGVSEMFLNLLVQRPADAERWIGEDELAPNRKHEKLPDAVLAASVDSRPDLVLEFGGAYDAHRVEQFHEDCAAQLLPYEIW